MDHKGAPKYKLVKDFEEAYKINNFIQVYQHDKKNEQWRTENSKIKWKIQEFTREITIKERITEKVDSVNLVKKIETLVLEKEDNKSELSEQAGLLIEAKSNVSKHSVSSDEQEEIQNRYFTDESVMFCKKCKNKGHSIKNCPSREMACFFCMASHSRSGCPESVICFACGGFGHARIGCPGQNNPRCQRCMKNHENKSECRYLIQGKNIFKGDLNRFVGNLVCFVCGRKGHSSCSTINENAEVFGEAFLKNNQYLKSLKTNDEIEQFMNEIDENEEHSLQVISKGDSLLKKRDVDQFRNDHFHQKIDEKDSQKYQKYGKHDSFGGRKNEEQFRHKDSHQLSHIQKGIDEIFEERNLWKNQEYEGKKVHYSNADGRRNGNQQKNEYELNRRNNTPNHFIGLNHKDQHKRAYQPDTRVNNRQYRNQEQHKNKEREESKKRDNNRRDGRY